MELIKIKNSTSMYELILKLKNKSKTQVKQSKNSPKNYHKLIMVNRAHGKKNDSKKLKKTCFNKLNKCIC